MAYETNRAPDAHPRRPPSVPVEVAVHIMLLATRQHLVQALLGAIFHLSQPTISRVLAWGREMVGEVVEPEMVTLDDVPAAERVLVDGALVPTGDRAGHDGLYSGKRHTLGVGVQVVGDRWGRLLEVVGPVPGSVHDARAWFDLGLHERLSDRLALTDLGYLGCSDPSVGCVVWTPTRKPPKEELSWAQRVANYAHSSVRAAVERAIAHLKQWKVLSGGYRGPLSRVGKVIRAVVALEKLRTHSWPLWITHPGCSPTGSGYPPSPPSGDQGNKSRITRDRYVRFRESRGLRCPRLLDSILMFLWSQVCQVHAVLPD